MMDIKIVVQAIKIIIELILAGLDKQDAINQASIRSGISVSDLKKFYNK